jgi:hypothetical protein
VANFVSQEAAVDMPNGKLLQFPMLNPALFSPEINSQALSATKVNNALYAAIRALPYIANPLEKEELRRSLCELLLPEGEVA